MNREQAREYVLNYLADRGIGVTYRHIDRITDEVENLEVDSLTDLYSVQNTITNMLENIENETREEDSRPRARRAYSINYENPTNSFINVHAHDYVQYNYGEMVRDTLARATNATSGECEVTVGHTHVTEVDADIHIPTEEDPYGEYLQSRPRKGKKISEKAMDIVRGDDFPKPQFKTWSSRNELGRIIDDWYRNIEYRDRWIFSRREREGFNRRNIGHFSLEDVMARMSKRKDAHELDTETSKFYDWRLGGTEWILRLELIHKEEIHLLISHYIHKPTNSEISYAVRYWDESQGKFKELITIFSEHSEEHNQETLDRVLARNTYEHSEEECWEEEYDEELF